jgi:phosphoglucosamine mutase
MDESLRGRYEDFLCSLLPAGLDLRGLRVVLDCANGSASAVAPELFQRLGADTVVMNAAPDGRNINLHCGSLHIEPLQARVPAEGANLGVAFDGDADRALFVSSGGRLVDGDAVLFIAARHMLDQGRLRNGLVIGTIMANLGLEAALGRSGIRLIRTPVGDKYVLEEMLRRDANLGGEQSGHIIFRDDHTTGDGLLTALRMMETTAATGRPLDELASGLAVFPQILKNVRVREKLPVEQLPEVGEAIRAAEREFAGEGRIVVRYSGTEALARVMVEARDEQQVRFHADQIAAAFQRAIGL